MGNWWGLLVVLVGAIVKLVAENWDKIKEGLSKVGQWIYDNVIKPVSEFFQGLWNGIVDTFNDIGKWFQDRWNEVANVFSSVGTWFTDRFAEAWQGIQNVFSGIVGFFSGIWNTIVSIFTSIGIRIGEAVSGAFRAVINAVLSAIENILNFPIRAINTLIGVINMLPRNKYRKITSF